MSEMPERIWAQRSMDGKVWDEPADSLDLYTDYVRADKYADLERQRDELVAAAGLVVNMWFQAPDAGNLAVALDELREALAKAEKAE